QERQDDAKIGGDVAAERPDRDEHVQPRRTLLEPGDRSPRAGQMAASEIRTITREKLIADAVVVDRNRGIEAAQRHEGGEDDYDAEHDRRDTPTVANRLRHRAARLAPPADAVQRRCGRRRATLTLAHSRSYKTAAIWPARRAQRSSTGLVDGRNDGPRARPALDALLFVVSLAVALGLAEIGARVVAPFFLFDGEIAFSRGPYRGHEGVPMETRDGVVMWRFPRDDRPPPRPVKQGFRIVVLGDSVLFPALVSDAHGAARRLETLLNEHLDGGPYEVVNLAEPGFDTQQEERMLLEAGFPLAPDLVLVGVTPNDQQEFALHDGQLLEVRFLHHMRTRHDAGWLGRVAH